MKLKYAKALFWLSLITVILFLLSGYGYQWNFWELGTAFTILRYSAYTAIGLSVISLGSIWFLRKEGFKVVSLSVIALLLMSTASITALYWQQKARSVPPIHDITTDLENPPEFVAMVRLRADAPNPPEYAGEESANYQREAYPHIQPLLLNTDIQDVMDEAVLLITERKWHLAAINRNDGRIEATEKLPWFGFKDDVVIRFSETGEGTRVDMRSKSRIGRSDIGVNADRIEKYLTDLKKKID